MIQPLKSLHTSKHNDPSSSRKRCVKVFLAGSKFPKGLCCGSEERYAMFFEGVVQYSFYHHDFQFYPNQLPLPDMQIEYK